MARPESSAQNTSTIVMVRPNHFGYNPETDDNRFQNPQQAERVVKDRKAAMRQFDEMTNVLKGHGVNVIAIDSPHTPTPDAIFPNNWFSTHDDKIIFYPMYAENRRAERQPQSLQKHLADAGVIYPTIIDLTGHEEQGKILEGTGSLVLDRINKVAYAIYSRRTNKELFDEWTKIMGYQGVFFHAADRENPPYHTNVIMSVGKNFAVVAPDLIAESDRGRVLGALTDSGRQVIEITPTQVVKLCGNIHELASNTSDRRKIVMSSSAYEGFTSDQRDQLKTHGELVQINIPTIEEVGGGGVRCMMAEVFTPQPIIAYQS